MVRALDELAGSWGTPKTIVVDDGPEFPGRALDAWAHRPGVQLHSSQPGKPTDNCYVESFNGRFRDECLSGNWFTGFEDAQGKIERWRRDNNETRPHSFLVQAAPAKSARDIAGTVPRGTEGQERNQNRENSKNRSGRYEGGGSLRLVDCDVLDLRVARGTSTESRRRAPRQRESQAKTVRDRRRGARRPPRSTRGRQPAC